MSVCYAPRNSQGWLGLPPSFEPFSVLFDSLSCSSAEWGKIFVSPGPWASSLQVWILASFSLMGQDWSPSGSRLFLVEPIELHLDMMGAYENSTCLGGSEPWANLFLALSEVLKLFNSFPLCLRTLQSYLKGTTVNIRNTFKTP